MSDDAEAVPEPDPGVNIIIEPAQMAGVWANFAQVSHSEHEFQIDFVRMDTANRVNGIVVARVGVSPLFVMQLIAALQDNWDKYAEKAMPKEVRDAEPPEDPKA
jgi:hypothetical protein